MPWLDLKELALGKMTATGRCNDGVLPSLLPYLSFVLWVRAGRPRICYAIGVLLASGFL